MPRVWKGCCRSSGWMVTASALPMEAVATGSCTLVLSRDSAGWQISDVLMGRAGAFLLSRCSTGDTLPCGKCLCTTRNTAASRVWHSPSGTAQSTSLSLAQSVCRLLNPSCAELGCCRKVERAPWDTWFLVVTRGMFAVGPLAGVPLMSLAIGRWFLTATSPLAESLAALRSLAVACSDRATRFPWRGGCSWILWRMAEGA